MISEVFNCDCMEYMKGLPDKFFDLAICDPPYGIGPDWRKRKHSADKYPLGYLNKTTPNYQYFSELFRVSIDWIIWGWNYYTQFIGPTNQLIFWDKCVCKTAFYSHGELAATSLKYPLRKVAVPWDGARRGCETGTCKIHPHQKPVALYRWLLQNYAKPGDKIFDSHMGSQSSRIAAHQMGFDYWGCELDEDYFKAGCDRFERESAQKQLFSC